MAPTVNSGAGEAVERTLAGLAVVVTRAGAGDEPLTRKLVALGAEVIPVPALVFEPPADPAPLERALAEWDGYDWVVFTSPRGVIAVAEAITARGGDPGSLTPRRLAVVGSSTGAAAREVGWAPDLVPERFDAEGLLEEMDRRGVKLSGARVLLPLAAEAREILGRGLGKRGAKVDQVIAYRSAAPPDFDGGRAAELLAADRPLLITFTSPSSARHLVERVGARALELPAAAIGPVTAAAAGALGFRVVATPTEEHTLDGLVAAVVHWWTTR